MKKAIFTGTFDPPTFGHLDIIERAALLFDKLYVALLSNSQKRFELLTVEDRIQFLKEITLDFPNVEVISFFGLAVDCALRMGAEYIVRGIRNSSDLDFEAQMAASNRQLRGIDTVVLLSSPSYSHISSTLVKEIAASGSSLKGFVPDRIEEIVSSKIKNKHRDTEVDNARA